MQHFIVFHTEKINCSKTLVNKWASIENKGHEKVIGELKRGLGHFGRGHYGRGHFGRGHYGRGHFGRGHLSRGHFGPLI